MNIQVVEILDAAKESLKTGKAVRLAAGSNRAVAAAIRRSATAAWRFRLRAPGASGGKPWRYRNCAVGVTPSPGAPCFRYIRRRFPSSVGIYGNLVKATLLAGVLAMSLAAPTAFTTSHSEHRRKP